MCLRNNAGRGRIEPIAMATGAGNSPDHHDGPTTLAHFVLLGVMGDFLCLAEARVFGVVRGAHVL